MSAATFLNYHHLRYFWAVAREGGVAAAARALNAAQPTVSAQVKALERALGAKLLVREGRRLVLTEMGRLAQRHADEIFALGGELLDAFSGRAVRAPLRFTVGVADAVPKLIAHRVLQAVRVLPEAVAVVCREDKPDRLMAELAMHGLDLVLSDGPANPALRVKVFSHPLGDCGITFFATARDAARLRRRFPRSLDGAPVLLPTPNTMLRRELDAWFERERIAPRVVGEFEDFALLKTFGQSGAGVFPAPSVIAAEVQRQYRVRVVGGTEAVRQGYYAVSVERRIRHPAVTAIVEAARQRLFV